MSVTFLDPRAEPGAPVEPYTLGIDLDATPITIGLLANGFPDSVNFLREIEVELAKALPHAIFKHYDKGNASAVANEAMLSDITGSCQAVVSAYGH